MTKKVILLSFLLISLSACIPGMNGYPNQNQYYGSNYRPQPMMNNGYNDIYSQNTQYNTNTSDISAYSQYPYADNTPLEKGPQNPWSTPAMHKQYSNTTMVQAAQPYPVQIPQVAPMPPMRNNMDVSVKSYQPKGVVGIGKTLHGKTVPGNVTNVSVNRKQSLNVPNSVESNTNLISPGSWRMAHPSIGNGLELINQTERFSLNNELNDVKIKKTANIKIGGKNVSVLGLNAAPVTNLKGYLCKEVYIVESKNRGQVKTMWGKFCRHPNWNEWILTKW